MSVCNMDTVYQVPLLLEAQGLHKALRAGLALDQVTMAPEQAQKGQALWHLWKKTVKPESHLPVVNICLVGKYVTSDDAYLSVRKSLEHSAMRCKRQLDLVSIDSEHLEQETEKSDPNAYHKAWKAICEAQAILVPGGFGSRGIEGMMDVTKWARERGVPFLGICLGMQVAVMEYARNVLGLAKATSEEISATAEHRVVVFMPEGSKE